MNRLNILGLHSLEYPRLKFDLILMYKICHDLSDLQFSDYFSYHKTAYNLRQHSLTIQSLLIAKHDQYRYFFFNRIVNIWNHLPEQIITTSSLFLFKLCLR